MKKLHFCWLTYLLGLTTGLILARIILSFAS